MSVRLVTGKVGLIEAGFNGFKSICATHQNLKEVPDSLIEVYMCQNMAFLNILWEKLPFYNFVVMESNLAQSSFYQNKRPLSLMYTEVFARMEKQRRFRWYMGRKNTLLPARIGRMWRSIECFDRYDTYIEDYSTKENGFEFATHNEIINRRRTMVDDYTIVTGMLKQEHRSDYQSRFV